MSAVLLRAWLGLGLVWAPPPDLPAEAEAPVEPAPAPEPASPAPSPAPVNPAEADAPITVTTRLTPDPAHIGDLLTLEVIVAYPRDHAINLPSGLDFAPLELVDVEEGPVEPTGKDLRQRFTITLQYFDVGELSVPSFPVTWIDPNDEVHTYSVAPHPFVVESLLANEADPQPRGADPMISLEYANVRMAEIVVAVIGGLLLAALIAVVVIFLRRRDRPVYTPPPVPPHERARAELDTLAREREELIAAGAYQDYYLRLTEIAKRYLGTRFGFEALDRTTEEIQDLLRRGQVRVDPLDPEAVLSFLQDCDLVKFARLSPPEDETREALQVVREMVDRTIPAPQTRAAEPGADEATEPDKEPDKELDKARATRPERSKPPSPAETRTAQAEPNPLESEAGPEPTPARDGRDSEAPR